MKLTSQLASFLSRQKSGASLAVLAAFQLSSSVQAQTTGFNQPAGTYDYNNTANWVGGTINGIWDPSLTVASPGQIVEFSTNTVLSTGLTFRETGGQNKTIRATGGAATLTLGGDILLNAAGNVAYTIGSTVGSSNLNVDLGNAVRTVTAFGGGNGSNFAKTLTFTNNVSNGGIIASGGGSGGGKIQFNALAISLSSATVRDAEMSFNGSNNTSANSVYTISGALTGGGGAGAVTVLPRSTKNTLLLAGSFVRNAGSTVLFRGASMGTQTIASATVNTSNISFGATPVMLGGGGAAGTPTIDIIAGAFGDTSSTGTGFGATGGLVTYDSANGVRLLAGSEYQTSITDGQTTLDNVRVTNSSGAIATTTLTNVTTNINSLSLGVSGATGNQGIIITGDPDTTLKLNSGVIYAEQNVTGTNPASTDAITISVPTLDLNGQEGIILATTRLNTGGTVTSNGALIITSTITNATGLIIGDNMATNSGGYVSLRGSAANTYTGNTTINGAIVHLSKSSSNSFGDIVLNLGSVYDTGNQIADTANVTINGGTFFLNGSNNSGSATNETLNNLTLTGGLINPGSGSGNTFNVNGNASLSGGTINMAQNAKLNIAGTTGLSGGVISIGTNNSASAYNSKTTLADAVSITNTAVGTAGYTPITIAAGSAAGNLGGQVVLTGDLTFTGNTNTNTVTIAAPTGTGLQGVIAMNGTRTFDIGNGSAVVDLTINAPLIDGISPGGLTKTGTGTLDLTGANAYTGNTTVSAGTLSLAAATLNDASAVNIEGSAVLNLAHGVIDTVADFQINGVSQGNGTFNSANSSGRITGSGALQVGASSDPFAAWIDTFTSLTDPADKTKDADPDLDGMNNLAEFALKGNPDNGSNNGLTAFLLQDTTPPVGNELTYIIAVRDGATFVSGVGGVQTASILADGLSYTVQGSINLVFPGSAVSHVSTSNTAPATTGLPDLTGTSWEYHTFRLNASEGLTGKGFLRVVTQPAP